MKKIFFISIIFLFSACSFFSHSVKPQKSSTFTIKVRIPDRSMAISEINKQAVYILSKANLNKPVKYEYKKFSGNDVVIFKSSSKIKGSPIKIESDKNGYKGIYLINHTDIELAKLKNKKLERITSTGTTLSEAIENGIKHILQNNVDNKGTVNVSGILNIVNIFDIKYTKKSVTIDFSIAYTLKENGTLTKKDKADFYAEIGITSYYHGQKDKAYQMAQKGLNIYENCDKCLYLKGFLNLKDGNYDRAVYFLEKAVNLNKDKFYYCQKLQEAYYKIYGLINDSTPQGKEYKKQIQTKAFELAAFMAKHFNPDGTVYKKKLPPVSKTTLKLNLPEIKNHKLQNGLTLSELPKNTLPLFNVTVLFNFGSVNNPKGKMGMIDTTMELLKEGAGDKDSKQIAQFIDKYGLNLSTNVTSDYSTIECSSLTQNAQKCIELLDMLIKKAQFDKKEFDKYMKKRIEYYHALTARASYLGNKLLYRLVFGKHNYGYYDATLKTLTNIKLDDIKNFYKTYFNSSNAYVIISGKYDNNTLENLKEKFSTWKTGEKTKTADKNRIKPLNKKRDLIYIIDRPSSKQTVIYYGQTIPEYSSGKILPLYMANLVFGGSSSSRLFMRLREKESLTYGAYSYIIPRLESGMFKAGLSVRNEVVGKAVNSLLDELKKFKNQGVTKQELDDKKGLETGNFAMKLQGFGYISMLIKTKIYNLPDDYFKTYTQKIADLTPQNVNKTVKEVIVPDNGIIVIVGDSNKFVSQLKSPYVILDENLKVKKTNVK